MVYQYFLNPNVLVLLGMTLSRALIAAPLMHNPYFGRKIGLFNNNALSLRSVISITH